MVCADVSIYTFKIDKISYLFYIFKTGSPIGSPKSAAKPPLHTATARGVMPPTSAQKGKPTTHQFNTPESEAVLGLQRLLVKVIGAKELPPSSNAQRRTCSAEVQLVGAGGAPRAGNPLHGRTGPPNHFATVKDTAPVWNVEFVAELSDAAHQHGQEWPSWLGHVRPPRARDASSEGFRLPSTLRRRGRASRLLPRGRGIGARPHGSHRCRCV